MDGSGILVFGGLDPLHTSFLPTPWVSGTYSGAQAFGVPFTVRKWHFAETIILPARRSEECPKDGAPGVILVSGGSSPGRIPDPGEQRRFRNRLPDCEEVLRKIREVMSGGLGSSRAGACARACACAWAIATMRDQVNAGTCAFRARRRMLMPAVTGGDS